jgi:hypothetical protein
MHQRLVELKKTQNERLTLTLELSPIFTSQQAYAYVMSLNPN